MEKEIKTNETTLEERRERLQDHIEGFSEYQVTLVLSFVEELFGLGPEHNPDTPIEARKAA